MYSEWETYVIEPLTDQLQPYDEMTRVINKIIFYSINQIIFHVCINSSGRARQVSVGSKDTYLP